MNITEFVKQIKHDSSFRSKTYGDGTWITVREAARSNNALILSFTVDHILADDWEIKKKEDVPINSEEYLEIKKTKIQRDERWFDVDIIDTWNASEKNNELKYKELVELSDDFSSNPYIPIELLEFKNDFKKALSKIK